MSSEADRSELKSVIFMALRRRKLRMTVGGGGGADIQRVVRMAKWSEGVAGRQIAEGE
jgi:hypothetical protein